MKKNKLLGLFIIFLFAIAGLGFSDIVRGNGLITWLYEENLNDYYESAGVYAQYQIYNKITPTETGLINRIGLYIFENPSNATHTEEIRLGIYTNFNNSPNALISQTAITPVYTVGWLDCPLTEQVQVTKYVDFWVGGILSSDSLPEGIGMIYYRIETNPEYITYGEGIRTFPNLYNPANATINVTETRFACLRLGLFTDDVATTSFLDLFENPTTYISGLIIVSIFVMIIYIVIRRR